MAEGRLDVAKIYEELSSDIRATDEISFKLMGLVPLISGTGFLALVLGVPVERAPLLIVFALSLGSRRSDFFPSRRHPRTLEAPCGEVDLRGDDRHLP